MRRTTRASPTSNGSSRPAASPFCAIALFEAIAAEHPRVPWQRWPDALRRPDTADAIAFAARHARSIRRTLYLQWLADAQLADAAHATAAAGLEIGLYRDLAVGAAPDGAEPWANGDAFATQASIGAPPDPFSTAGQVWSLPPPNPLATEATGCAHLRDLLAANMRHAAALRIDHAMGLSRLFWVPDGASGADGAYVAYPLAAQLACVALASARASCLVVGEDLGTVPDGLRERLSEARVLSYRVLWFERDGDAFLPPARWPAQAAACVTTHDLPTIAGWWNGADIVERGALGLLADAKAAHDERLADKVALVAALELAGIVPAGAVDVDAPCDSAIGAAIHGYIGATPCALALIQADDLAGETMAINLPATDRERANWRRRLGIATEGLWQTALGVQTATDLRAARGAS